MCCLIKKKSESHFFKKGCSILFLILIFGTLVSLCEKRVQVQVELGSLFDEDDFRVRVDWEGEIKENIRCFSFQIIASSR